MTIQLLINEEQVKALLPISQNLAGEYLSSAMFEAQEIGLKNILGSALLHSMKEHAQRKDWDEHPAYARLRDEELNYLIYQTAVFLCKKVSYKIANIGVVQTNDANVNNASRVDMDALIDDYQGKADFFCYELQRFLLAHYDDYGELDSCQYGQISENLTSMSSCGIMLDGARGFMERRW